MIKLLAIDMDGTCLNRHNIISDNNLNALKILYDKGINIIPTTGRALDCLPHQLLNENFYQYAITSSGAKITDIKNNICLYQEEIDKDIAISFLKRISKLKIGIDVHVDNHFVVQGKLFKLIGNMIYGKDANRTKVVSDVCDYIIDTKLNVEEIQIYFFDRKTKDIIHQILLEYKKLSYAFSNHYVEIYSNKASKGNAIDYIANILNIKQREIASVGDGDNDISMFNRSGLKFAMNNASDSLKAKADIILASNNDDGIYHLLRYI